jgi:signal-transduction protein with cAMP-binding, CBS, and nucleotidyltransferase domain
MRVCNYRKGDVVVKKGEPVSKFFVCLEGRIVNSAKQLVMQKGQSYGEEGLYSTENK